MSERGTLPCGTNAGEGISVSLAHPLSGCSPGLYGPPALPGQEDLELLRGGTSDGGEGGGGGSSSVEGGKEGRKDPRGGRRLKEGEERLRLRGTPGEGGLESGPQGRRATGEGGPQGREGSREGGIQ